MSEVVRRKIDGCWYDLHLESTGADPEWPWFVNAYERNPRVRGWRYPARFCAGQSRDDAIERVTRGIKGEV